MQTAYGQFPLFVQPVVAGMALSVWLSLAGCTFGIQFPAKANDFAPLHSVQTRFGFDQWLLGALFQRVKRPEFDLRLISIYCQSKE
jgi:hypothetical protein